VTEKDTYPLPNMMDFSKRFGSCKVFLNIDLRKGYYQIQMHPQDVHKTAITTPFGLWEFKRHIFGLRYMDKATSKLEFCFCYQDDLLVASPDMETHLHRLQQVFLCLRQYGLVINLKKRLFAYCCKRI